MRALFIGGTVDNSELDLDGGEAPQRYPASGTGQGRYRLHHMGMKGDEPVYAVYAAPDLGDEHVMQVALERDYARRFAATAEMPAR